MPANRESSSFVIQVRLAERSYPIHIGSQTLAGLSSLLCNTFPHAAHAVVMHDSQVSSIADVACQQAGQANCRVTRIEIPSGESSKSVEQAARIWNAMLADHTDRGSIVLAVGGGVVGDLAGFMAATFARGIPLVQIPTTLLSQVDSSVGGKTGINLPGAKNIVGAFWQPSLVVIDSSTLDSLPEREYVSGLAEVAKYGVILLPDLFEFLEKNCIAVVAKQADAIAHIVKESCQAKAHVVQHDERETSGLRAILNYGHTFAHALESATGYGTLLHGEAVAIGMHMAATLAQLVGRVDQAFVTRQRSLLQNLQLPVTCAGADPDQLWQLMQHDKKVQHGKLHFILPSRLGQVELVSGIDRDDVCAAIAKAASQ